MAKLPPACCSQQLMDEFNVLISAENYWKHSVCCCFVPPTPVHHLLQRWAICRVFVMRVLSDKNPDLASWNFPTLFQQQSDTAGPE